MNNNISSKNLNIFLLSLIIFLVIFGFWGKEAILFLSSQFLINFYPQLLATLVGAALGIPIGLSINRLTENRKDIRILSSLLIFIKAELISNKKNIENLQEAAEKINSVTTIGRNDLRAFGKFNNILSQKSYIAAQSSEAFASIKNDSLINSIVNAYLNIQRTIDGAVALEELEPQEGKILLMGYIKLCERGKTSLQLSLIEIDQELKKFGNTISIIE